MTAPPSTEQHHHVAYRADIDGLRAVSILSVVAFHVFPGKFTGGFIGVDIFFVISGYLITGILLRDLQADRFNIIDFWRRRVLRIFPALLLVLFFCLLLGWFALLADEYRQLGKHIRAASVFLSNFVLMGEAGYFDVAAENKPLLHLWSLGVEEQFYLLWPLLLYLAHKTGLPLLAGMLLLTVTSFTWNVAWVGDYQTQIFYAPHTRLWELAAGGCLAWLALYRKKTARKNLGNAQSLLGALLIVGSVFGIDQQYIWPGAWALLPVTAALLIVGAGENAWLNRVVLSHRLLVWLGLISFPLYVWHWPLLSFARLMEGGMPQREIRMAAALLAVVLAWLTYAVVERRVRTTSAGRRATVKTLILLTIMAVAAVLGHVVKNHDGWPQRTVLQGMPPPIDALKDDEPDNHAQCLARYGLYEQKMRYCKISGEGKPHIALAGDSHAAALFSGLAQELKNRDNTGLVMMGGYLYVNARLHPKGQRAEFEAYTGGSKGTEVIAREKSIDTVILAGRGPVYINTPHEFYLENQPDITDKKKVLEVGLRSVFDLMLENGKKVIYVLEVPSLNFQPQACLKKRPLRLTNKTHDCLLPKSWFDADHREYLELVNLILKDYPSVKVFDPSRYLCDAFSCTAKLGDKILYGDDNHLSADGSLFLAQELVKLLD